MDTASLDALLQRATDFLTSSAFAGGAISGLTAATEFLAGVVLMTVVLFFFLKDGAKMWNFTLRWFHGGTRARLAESGDRAVQVPGALVAHYNLGVRGETAGGVAERWQTEGARRFQGVACS